MSEQKGLSRRKFLVGAGLATGALAAAGASVALPGNAEAAYTAFPWPLATLNLTTVRRRGYDNYYLGGCMYASAKALLDTLAETAGGPWATVPVDLFKYGSGGVSAWGTICGALNGACWVIQASAGANASKVIDSLFGWYDNFAFPSSLHNSYCVYPNQGTTVSHNPLCHVSSTTWSKERGYKINSAQRKDRCAKLAGDVAAKAAEYLNKVKAGTFVATWKPDSETQSCMNCHVGTTSTYDNVQMKSSCHECHGDHGHGMGSFEPDDD